MLTLLVNLLILIVIAVVVFYVAEWLMAKGDLDAPIRKIILLILCIVFLIALINVVSGHPMWGPIVIVPAGG